MPRGKEGWRRRVAAAGVTSSRGASPAPPTRRPEGQNARAMAPKLLTPAWVSGENPDTPLEDITRLSAAGKGFTGIANLDALPKLRGADLSNNALDSLAGLQYSEHLSWLKVAGNGLQSLADLRPLSKLTTLNAGNNKLRSLEGVGALTSLRALVLNDNELSDYRGLGDLEQLDALVLSRNRITELGPGAFKHYANLTKLSLSNNKLRTIGGCLRRCLNLQELRVTHNLLTELPEDLALLQSLRIIEAGHNELRSTQLPLLRQLRGLKHLTLQGNPCANAKSYSREVVDELPDLTHFDNKPIEGRARVHKRVHKGDRLTFKVNQEALKGTIYAAPKKDGVESKKELEAKRAAERKEAKAERRRLRHEARERRAAARKASDAYAEGRAFGRARLAEMQGKSSGDAKEDGGKEDKLGKGRHSKEEKAVRKAAKEAKARARADERASALASKRDGASAGADTDAARSGLLAVEEGQRTGSGRARGGAGSRSGAGTAALAAMGLVGAATLAGGTGAGAALGLGAGVGRGGASAWDDEPAPAAPAAAVPAAVAATAAVSDKRKRKKSEMSAGVASDEAANQHERKSQSRALKSSRWALKKS